MNESGLKQVDVLEWLKILITILLGYIIIKALLNVS